MSEIADKYGMTDGEYKRAICDGLISTSWVRKEEIFVTYKEKLKNAKNKTEAAKQAADASGCDPSYVYQVLKEKVFSTE